MDHSRLADVGSAQKDRIHRRADYDDSGGEGRGDRRRYDVRVGGDGAVSLYSSGKAICERALSEEGEDATVWVGIPSVAVKPAGRGNSTKVRPRGSDNGPIGNAVKYHNSLMVAVLWRADELLRFLNEVGERWDD